jgi:hypothetical protein
MHVCLDIDDTITYAPELFTLLVSALPDARVTVVTFRTEVESARQTLRDHGIRFDQLILSNDPEHGRRHDQTLSEWKADLVNRLAPDWFFEDMPEVVCRVEPTIKVFMPCDDVIRGWLGDMTG